MNDRTAGERALPAGSATSRYDNLIKSKILRGITVYTQFGLASLVTSCYRPPIHDSRWLGLIAFVDPQGVTPASNSQ